MWKTVKLGEACVVRRGTTITKKQTIEGKVPVIGGGTKPTYYHNESNRAANCITISGSGASAGFVNKWGVPIFASDCSTVEPKDETQLHQFVYYYLMSQQQFIYDNFRSGAAQPHVYAKDIETLDYPIVSLPEQQRIVAKLDAAFAEIDRAMQVVGEQIQENHKLFESAVEAKFKRKSGWVEKTLQEVCEKITDGTHQTPKYFKDGYIFLSSKNVTTRKIDWDNVKYIDEEQHVAMQKRLSPKVGDILLAKNGTTGVAAMVDRDVEFDIYVSLAWLRTKGEVTPNYLLQFINSNTARAQFSNRTKGIGVPNLHLKEIREVEISFPVDKSEQQKVIVMLDEIDALYQRRNFLLCEKKANLYQLKSAILAQELQPPRSEAA